jgi:organic radical activating enzyme
VLKINEMIADHYLPKSEFIREDPPFPKMILVELSNGCNHKCVFCMNSYMKRDIGLIDKVFIERILREAKELGAQAVGFHTTGEPFVCRWLEEAVTIASSLGFDYIFITTNGALPTRDRLRATIDAGLHSMKFSINAGSRESYKIIHGRDDWDKVIENLKFVSEYRKTLNRPFNLAISYVMTDLSNPQAEDFRKEMAPLVDEIFFNAYADQMGQLESVTKHIVSTSSETPSTNFRDTKYCLHLFNRLHVSCEGYLTLCCADFHNYTAILDINNMSLADAWHHPAFRSARRRHLEENLDGTICGKCWHGSRKKYTPFNEDLATTIDEEAQVSEITDATEKRFVADTDGTVSTTE